MLAQSSPSSSTPLLSLLEHIQQLKQNFKDWQAKSPDYRLKHSEHSPLFQIMNNKELYNFLSTDDSNLLNQILDDEINLELASKQGMSQPLLLALILLEEGRSRLNPELIAQITEESLNQVIPSGEDAGYSPLFLLTSSVEGRAILDKHPELIAQITKEGLNQVIQSGEDAGSSPLYGLTGTSEGRAILNNHPDLTAQITQEGLNQVIASGEDAGYSPLFLLTSSVEGRAILDKHPDLTAQITQEGLNQVIPSGVFAGYSPLLWLTGNPEGLSLLGKHPELIAQITQESLNQVIQSGASAGESPLFWLTGNPKGQAILDKHPELTTKITQKGLNQVIPSGAYAGHSPLFLLTINPEGRAILVKHPELTAKITKESLNQIVTSGEHAGKSPLYWLTATPEGLSLLDKHPELIAQITQESLNQVIQSGEDTGHSPLYLLMGRTEGRAFLSNHPELTTKITQKGLNQVIPSGAYAGHSPLYWLTANPEGRVILDKHPELIANITKEGLNQVIQSGASSGKSPLYRLIANPEGRAILDKHPKLIAQITSEAAKLQVFKAFQQHPNEEYSGHGLAYCHEKGIGCPLDKAQALSLYLKAANVGILEAKLACARLYEEKAQFHEAMAVYQEFIQEQEFSDFSSAQRAQILWMTLKLKMDAHIEASICRLFKAAASTEPQGSLGLGQCYLYGIGTPANFNQAKRCFQTASEYEETKSQAHKYLEVLSQHNNFAKYYCDELADKLSVLGIEVVGSPNDGFYQFQLSADFMNQLVDAGKAKIGQLGMDKAALLKLSGILLPSQGWQAYPSLIAVFKKAYSTQQKRLKIEAVMALKNSRLEVAERFDKAYEELSKLLRDNAPPVYRAWNNANQIHHDLSSGEGNSSVLKKNAGFFNFFTSLTNKFRDHEQALAGNRDQYLDHYLAFHQRYIKRDNLNKAIAAYQVDDFENGDILLDKAQGQVLLAEMNQALENVQKMISELRLSLDGFQSKHKDFERFAGHYRYQRPVDTSGNLSETVSIPAYLEYIQAAELEYARSEAANKALPPAIEESKEEEKEEIENEEKCQALFDAVSAASQPDPILLSEERLRALPPKEPAVMTSASSAVSSNEHYFSRPNFGKKAFNIRLTLELSSCVKAVSSLSAGSPQDEWTALTYALLYEVGDVMEAVKNLGSKQFYYPCAAQLRNVLYHGKKLAQIKQPHLYFNDYLELAQKLAAYLEGAAASPQVFDTQELMAKIPCGLFNTLLNHPLEQEQFTPEEIIELITDLNGQASLIQDSKLSEEYKEKACKFIVGRKGALLADLERKFQAAYALYFAHNIEVKTERELGKEFRHG